MNGRILTERLLATSSLAALILAAGAPGANAAPLTCTTVAAGASYSNSGAVNCVTAPNNSVSITNNASGTIGPVAGSTPTVAVSGTLSGGITNAGTIRASVASGISNAAVLVSGFVQGGITNSGTITAAATGSATNYGAIAIGIPGFAVSSFGGGITNSGTLSASGQNGTVNVITINTSTFSGGITNNGAITGGANSSGGGACANAAGMAVNGTTFNNGIVNNGAISITAIAAGTSCAHANAIGVTVGASIFTGSIVNNGTISVFASATAGSNSYRAGANASGFAIETGVFNGGFTNNGTISASALMTAGSSGSVAEAAGLSVYAITFGGGNIVNNGTITASATARNVFCGSAVAYGILVDSPTFNAGLTNAGTISASATITNGTSGTAIARGVNVVGSTFSGGITNAGLISASATANGTGTASDRLSATGIWVTVSNFSGGISNSGAIIATASGANATRIAPIGIFVDARTSFGGNISNSGTISASASSTIANGFLDATGIRVIASTFGGSVANSGTISAAVTGGVGAFGAYGVTLSSRLSGGLSNGGTISASAVANGSGTSAVQAAGAILSVGTLSASIVNTGQITATATGSGITGGFVEAVGVALNASTFGGGASSPAISNSGSIIARASYAGTSPTGAQAYGVSLFGNSILSGGIVNSGTIAGLITSGNGVGVGIQVTQAGAVTISNSGLIEGSTWGIRETNSNGNNGTLTINLSGGTIMGSTGTTGGAIAFSTGADVLNITGGTIIGNVVGSGLGNSSLIQNGTRASTGTVNVDMGTGSFNYAYEIEAIGTLNLKSGTLLLQNLTGPGASVSTYNQTAGSTLALELSPAATNNHATLAAIGTVSLGAGSVLQAYEGAFNWTPGTYTYAGVVTAGTINGSFVASSNSPFFTASLTQTQNQFASLPEGVNGGLQPPTSASDTLTLTMLSPSQVPGLNANQVAVANAILGIPGGNATLDQIFLLPGSSTSSGPSAGLPTLGNALTQLTGSQYSTTNYQPLIASWQTFTDSLSGRLQGNNYNGPVTGSLNPGNGIQFAQADLPQLAQSGVVNDSDTRTLRGAPPRVASQWGVWGRGYGLTSNGSATSTSAAFSESGAGLMVGADNQITDRIVAGVALNVSSDKASVVGGGFTQTDAYQGSVYGQYTVDPNWYVNGMAGFGWQTYKTARVVNLLTTNVNNGSFDGQSYRVYGESGYALHPAFLPQTQVTPYAGLGYLHTHTDSFTETGSATALNVQAMDPNSFTMTLGARAAATMQIGTTVFRPELRAAWQHEFLDSAATMRSSFVVAPSTTFTSTGAGFGDDSFLGGAGITTTITASTQLFLDYDARVTGGYTAQAVSGGMRVQF